MLWSSFNLVTRICIFSSKSFPSSSTSKKPTSVRIGDLEEREATEDEKKLGQVSPHGEEENPNTKKLPKYSEREERSGMMGKPHKERKRRDTEESLARIEADTEERRKKLKERREQEKTESERKENEKKQDKEWDDKKLINSEIYAEYSSKVFCENINDIINK